MSIPVDKIDRAYLLIQQTCERKKVTVRQMQQLCGYLNFLCRCVVPGRAFTRRLYSHYTPMMKPFYHINVTREIKDDLTVWKKFLAIPNVYCRPFIDYSEVLNAEQIQWFTDASGVIGVGGIWNGRWFQMKWSDDLLEAKPSIKFQELYGVTVSVLLWAKYFCNRRICLFCDNMSSVFMINLSSSRCKSCMNLVRIITLESMKHNVRIFAKHLKSEDNFLADELSRFQMVKFWRDVNRLQLDVNSTPELIPQELLPVERQWLKTANNKN